MNAQLQKVAEQVLDVETRIINWEGNVTEWARDLIRLRITLELLLETACDMRDTTQKDFLNDLLKKTSLCRENVLSRARWITDRNKLHEIRDGLKTESGDAPGVKDNHTINERIDHGNDQSYQM